MDSEDTSLRAAEYVLGLLPREERDEIERRIERDAELRGEVDLWQANLATLFDGVEVAPPPAVARRLQDELFGERVPDAMAPGAWMPDWLTAALVVKAMAIGSLVLWLLLSL